MRILLVADVSPVVLLGGGERALWEMARGLAARGHQVRIVSRAPEKVGPGRLVHRGVPVRHFAVDRRSLVGFVRSSVVEAARAVRAELAAGGADVLHVQQPLSALGALAVARGRTLPVLYTVHSPAPLEYRLRRGTTPLHRGGAAGWAAVAMLWAAERATLGRAARVHVLSDFSARLLRRIYRIAPARITRIPGGVDAERFRPAADRAAVRRRLGLPADRPILFTLRNLQPRMGLDALLEAMGRLRREHPEVLLLLGGAGPLGASLERQARALGLDAHVRFLGFVPEAELPAYYAAADAFVLPTRALEGFGLVTVEALACGTPVLGTPVGATPEILGELDPSLVFRDATAGAIADGLSAFLARLARDPGGVARLRDASRRHAERGYAWPGIVADLERLLAGLASGSGRTCPVCGGGRWRPFRHAGRPFAACRRCRTAVAAALPDRATLRRVYEAEYPARFPPARCGPRRAALLAGLLAALGPPRPAALLLDVGCGGGHLLATATALGWRGIGSDLSLEACRTARKGSGAPVLQADAAALPVRDRAAAAVTLVNVLDHLPDPRGALGEARRVLVPGGTLLIRLPNGRFHRPASRALARAGPLAHATGLGRWPVLHLFSFDAAGLRRLVEDAGFEVLAVRNSPLAAAADGEESRRPLGVVAALVGAVARGLEVGSGGRWLVAPSIELLARAPRLREPRP